jgi:hypothetical protein
MEHLIKGCSAPLAIGFVTLPGMSKHALNVTNITAKSVPDEA